MAAAKSSYFLIALALLLYLFFSLTHLELPGLQFDEVNFVSASLGGGNQQFVAYNPKIFGKRIPLMIMSYIGALKSGLYAPIFKYFGTSASVVRLPVVCIGLITLLMSFALFRQIFDWRVAVVGISLLATDPTFIFGNKLDWGPVSLLLALEVSSLYFLWRWMVEEKRYLLGIAGFLLGLGLYNKIIFAWCIAALFIGLLLLFRAKLREILARRNLALFLPAFVLGCLPLIAFNIDIKMGTFRNQQVMTVPGFETINSVFELFRGTLDGGGIYYLVNQAEVADTSEILKNGSSGNLDFAITSVAAVPWVHRSWIPLAFALSCCFILILWALRRLRMRREILFAAVNLVVIAAFIFLSPEARGAHHVIATYPFVFLLIAFAICETGQWLGKTRFKEGVLISGCVMALIVSQLIVDARYLKSFQVKGGVQFWSDAIYDLASFASENPDKTFVLTEWGLSNQLILLTGGRIRFEDFTNDISKNPGTYLDSMVTRTNYFLVFYAPPLGDQTLMDAYQKFLDRHHLQGRIRKTFFQRDGRPIYLAYETVQPMPESRSGNFYYMREAEDYDKKSGGDLDLKPGALNGKALGMMWGRKMDDFASYRFTLPNDVPGALLRLRYAFEKDREQHYYIFLDNQLLKVIAVPSSKGFGYTKQQWRFFETSLGDLPAGHHEIKFEPTETFQEINLDFFEIRRGSPGDKPQPRSIE